MPHWAIATSEPMPPSPAATDVIVVPLAMSGPTNVEASHRLTMVFSQPAPNNFVYYIEDHGDPQMTAIGSTVFIAVGVPLEYWGGSSWLPFTGGGGGPNVIFVDNGDGTYTASGPGLIDNGNGTWTATGSGIVDNGNGTYTA